MMITVIDGNSYRKDTYIGEKSFNVQDLFNEWMENGEDVVHKEGVQLRSITGPLKDRNLQVVVENGMSG